MKGLTCLCILVLSAVGWSDTLELKDGKVLDGKYLGGTQNTVRFQVAGAVKTIPVSDVLALTFSGTAPAPNAPAGGATPSRSATGAPAGQAAPAASAAPAPAEEGVLTVPDGTRLLFRMRETLDSRRHKTGHMFTAALEADLVVGKTVVAKKGSLVYGKLLKAKKSGRIAGRSQLVVQVTDLMVGGKPHNLDATPVAVVSESTAKSSAKKVGGAAAIGGLIKGSKGAKKGAKVGAGLSIVTRGKQVQIPQGTLLEVTLQKPLRSTP